MGNWNQNLQKKRKSLRTGSNSFLNVFSKERAGGTSPELGKVSTLKQIVCSDDIGDSLIRGLL